jgi:hypothetical protein
MKRMFIFASAAFLLGASCKEPVKQDDAILLRARAAGMFSVLDNVFSVADCYDRKFCSAVKVDFADTGLYYDQDQGLNWFDYYFERIDLGTPKRPFWIMEDTDRPNINFPDASHFNRDSIAQLVEKYIKVKPYIAAKVQAFVKGNFGSGFVVGVHYRGTDKSEEAIKVPYERVVEEILKLTQALGLNEYKIFLATDEQAMIDFLQAQFPGRVTFNPNAERSDDGNPLHLGGTDSSPSEIGEQALIDCLLLSKTNALIRTSSNLSRWSTYFNPKIPVIELSQRFR